MVRRLTQIVVLSALVSTARADFANPDEWNNGADLRHVRRALIGRPDEMGVPILEEVTPPTDLEGPTSVLHELRAQTVLMHQTARLLCVLVGLALSQIALSRVRL